jgi:phosphoketolase
MLNGMSRYHLAAEVLRHSGEYPNSRPQTRAPTLISECGAPISRASAYARRHLEDEPEIRERRWDP